MQIDLQQILDELTILRDEIYGCGNGRVKVDKFIKDIKRKYGIYNPNGNPDTE